MGELFERPAPASALTSTGERFPVRRIFCLGRNYAAHIREMGKDPAREAPFFFTKWAETIVANGDTVPYPPETQDFQFEAELVVAIGKSGRSIPEGDVAEYIFGYAVGLDMTRRDLQFEAREKGRPWDAGKNVEHSSPLGPIHPSGDLGGMTSGAIRLTVNGIVKQEADLSDMVWSVPEIVAYVSRYYRLEPGDLIYTGTPAGVGPVVPGDLIEVAIDGLLPCQVCIGELAE